MTYPWKKVPRSAEEVAQQSVDDFYRKHGPCCAGCDHWRWLNAAVGQCLKSPIVPSEEVFRRIGIESPSIKPTPGHVMTMRDDVCGLFEDTHDWSPAAE